MRTFELLRGTHFALELLKSICSNLELNKDTRN